LPTIEQEIVVLDSDLAIVGDLLEPMLVLAFAGLFPVFAKTLPERFYRYVLGKKTVHLTAMGLRDMDRFCGIAAVLAERAMLTPKARADMEVYGAEMRTSGKLK